jgi:hypothetical protein
LSFSVRKLSSRSRGLFVNRRRNIIDKSEEVA